MNLSLDRVSINYFFLRLTSLVLLLTLSVNASSQILEVIDASTKERLESVMILCEQPKYMAITGPNGQADIALLKGASEIQIILLGYQPLLKSFEDLERREFRLELTSTGIVMNPLVISATRWNQQSSSSPEKISQISPREVSFQNPQTAADLLGIGGEVFIQKSQQGGGSPMIRGFSANRLLYVVDGVRMNTAIFRGGNLQNVISLDPFMMESTEVLFGPGSVMYGSDAIGGVMNFSTYAPQFSSNTGSQFNGRALNRISTANNEHTYHLRINMGGSRVASVTSFTRQSYGDLKMGSHGPTDYLRPLYVERINGQDSIVKNDDPRVQRPTGFDQVNFTQKLSYKLGKREVLEYGFHYSESSPNDRYDRLLINRNGSLRYGDWMYGPQVWSMHNLSLKSDIAQAIYDQVILRSAVQKFKESRISRDLNSEIEERRFEEVDAYSINLDMNKSWHSKHELFYGIESVLNRVHSKGMDTNILTGVNSEGPSRYPQSDWQSHALYVTNQYKSDDYWLFTIGARYNLIDLQANFDTTFYPFNFTKAELSKSALTSNLGVVYTPNEQWILSANVATGFRAPNVDDIGKVFDSEPGVVVVPNPDLAPEYVYNAEVRIMWTDKDWFRIDVSGFYTLLDQAMVRRDYSLSGLDSIFYDGELSRVQAIQNAAQTVVYGIQTGVEVKLSDNLRFLSRFNIQEGEEELNDGTLSPSRHAAPWFGLSSLSYTKGKFKLQGALVYNGEQSNANLALEEQGKAYLYALDENGQPYSPGWYIFNLKGEWKVNHLMALNLGIENLTDQRYRPYSSGIAGAGRNLIASVRMNF